jgi:protein ImuB
MSSGMADERLEKAMSQLYACVYLPPPPRSEPDMSSPGDDDPVGPLVHLARKFTPRFEVHGDRLVTLDVSGLERVLGAPPIIGHELRLAASRAGMAAHVAVAGTRVAALITACGRAGLNILSPGEEAKALAPLPLRALDELVILLPEMGASEAPRGQLPLDVLKRWGIKTLGELAALPPSDLSGRLGQEGLQWQRLARGEDRGTLVPELPDERFEASLDLEWPVESLEPLSFVLGRLLEPLCARLESRGRAAAVLHVRLLLVSREVHTRRLQLPAPMRDPRVLRTLALLDLESNPPPAGIDRVMVAVDPAPEKVTQFSLLARALPAPERLTTVIARLEALMGQGRCGAALLVDSYRPGAFETSSFRIPEEETGNRSLSPADGPRAWRRPRWLEASTDLISRTSSRYRTTSGIGRQLLARWEHGARRFPHE